MYEKGEMRENPMERETEVVRPIEGVWDRRTGQGCGTRGRSGPFEGRER